MTPQIINKFFLDAVANDFTRDYHFRIDQISIGGGEILGPDDLIFAKAGKLPGRNIVNQQVKYAGQTFNLPGSVEFTGSENYEMEFYATENSDIRNRLLDESRRTFNAFDGTAGYVNNGTGYALGSIAGPSSWMIVQQLNKLLQPVRVFRMVGVSIRNVGEVSYEIAEGNGAIKTFTASFAYHFFDDNVDNLPR